MPLPSKVRLTAAKSVQNDMKQGQGSRSRFTLTCKRSQENSVKTLHNYRFKFGLASRHNPNHLTCRSKTKLKEKSLIINLLACLHNKESFKNRTTTQAEKITELKKKKRKRRRKLGIGKGRRSMPIRNSGNRRYPSLLILRKEPHLSLFVIRIWIHEREIIFNANTTARHEFHSSLFVINDIPHASSTTSSSSSQSTTDEREPSSSSQSTTDRRVHQMLR